jgi:hypothetical protein
MAIGIVDFVFFIMGSLLQLLLLAIIISAILSWLFAFDVVLPTISGREVPVASGRS